MGNMGDLEAGGTHLNKLLKFLLRGLHHFSFTESFS